MDLTQMLSELEGGNDEAIEQLLQRYNRENSRTFAFDEEEEPLRMKLCQSTLDVLSRVVAFSCQRTCLETLRIMSRDKRVLSPVSSREGLLVLTAMARLSTGEDALHKHKSLQDSVSVEEERVEEEWMEEEQVVVVEALKCLCNVVFNSPAAQQVSVEVQLGPALCGSLQSSHSWSHEVGLFSLRLLFLLSALRPDVRASLRERRAVQLLATMLEQTLEVRWVGPYEAEPVDPQAAPVPAQTNDRVMEALKALFNLTLNHPDTEEEEHQFRVIVGILRHLLMLRTETMEKTEEVHSHAVNLLNNLPVSCLDVLLPPAGEAQNYSGKNLEAQNYSGKNLEAQNYSGKNLETQNYSGKNLEAQNYSGKNLEAQNYSGKNLEAQNYSGKNLETQNYSGKNLEAVQLLLEFMEKRIDKCSNYKEGLTPVLCLLTEASRHHREIRRFLKAQVLPPLKNVKVKPEVGNSLRNKLVRLMTHVDLGVKHAAAEFLFVLCKEKVASLLKYTGYGNAAGLLMARGLLVGGRGETQYSEGEDSDTEEYKSATNFDIMSGCEEDPRPNPMEEMTEEQKEHEAEKLFRIINEMKRHNVIHPMVVRSDGRLGPLEEELHMHEPDSHSDSD